MARRKEETGVELPIKAAPKRKAYKPNLPAYHQESRCAGTSCPWHNPSEHALDRAPMHIRMDRDALVERICPHGVGHPDPDSVRYLTGLNSQGAYGYHGCDGCCADA